MDTKPESQNRMGTKVKLQKSYMWNKTIEEFVKNRVKGYSLNVCAGKSAIGDVKMDLDPQDKSILKGDMRDLKFQDNTFDTVIQDPPWKIGFYQRMAPFFECVRVCKVGGQIIYNAYWIPASKYIKLKEIWVRQDREWANASVISIFEKIAQPQGLECKEAGKPTQSEMTERLS